MKGISFKWRITGWVLSVATILATIESPSSGLLALSAIVVLYWGAKWKKPLWLICRTLIGAVSSSGGFVKGQVKKIAARRSARGGVKID